MPKIFKDFSKLFYVDLRSLAITRIALSLLIIIDLFARFKDLENHYTDNGVLPVEAYYELHWQKFYLSLHALSGNYYFELFLFIAALIFACMLLFGFKTRMSTVISWFLLISLQTRNPLVLTGGDTLLRCLMFWAIFTPWGERFSIDSNFKSDCNKVLNTVFSWGALAFIIQIAFMYISSAILKDSPEWRNDYTAIYYALSIGQFNYLLGPFIYRFPLLMKVITFSVFWLEMVGIFIFFVPYKNSLFRIIGLILFIFFQLGLFFTMSLGLFPWVCIASLFIFLPSIFWKKLPGFEIRLKIFFEKIYTKLFYNSRCRFFMQPDLKKIHALFLILVFIFLAILVNNRNFKITEVPRDLFFIIRTVRLDQKWNLFAPEPYKTDGWYVISGKLENGNIVDVLRKEGKINWASPNDRHSDYPTYRWRKYMRNLYLKMYKENRHYYAKYICRKWNKDKAGKPKLKYLDIYYVLEWT
ncbi:MAG: HTTM domain-containing protein, partial [Thermodesulfobacteriota bacterium]